MKVSTKISGFLSVLIIAGVVAAMLPVGVLAADADQKGVPGCPGFGQGKGPGFGPRMMQTAGPMWTSIAKFLGMDDAAFRSERQAGKSVVQIAKEKGKSEEEVINYVVAQHKARLDQLVKNGTLTREQAAAREGFMKERIQTQIKSEGYGRGMGGCGRWANSSPGGRGPGQGARGPAQQ